LNQPPHQHPFARYPYVYQAPVPGYIGPQWAAPLPYRPLPPRTGTSGCLVALIVLLVLFAGGLMLGDKTVQWVPRSKVHRKHFMRQSAYSTRSV
jgi:hypothetical protein